MGFKGRTCGECDFFLATEDLNTWCRESPVKGFRVVFEGGKDTFKGAYPPTNRKMPACGRFVEKAFIEIPKNSVPLKPH